MKLIGNLIWFVFVGLFSAIRWFAEGLLWCVTIIGNLIWFVFVGLFSAIGWFAEGLLWCVTIIGIPFGIQCFKLGVLTIWPFGHNATVHFERHPIANVIWLIFGGLELCVAYAIVGVLFCITIIGIPFGKQCFKLAQLALLPFGADVH